MKKLLVLLSAITLICTACNKVDAQETKSVSLVDKLISGNSIDYVDLSDDETFNNLHDFEENIYNILNSANLSSDSLSLLRSSILNTNNFNEIKDVLNSYNINSMNLLNELNGYVQSLNTIANRAEFANNETLLLKSIENSYTIKEGKYDISLVSAHSCMEQYRKGVKRCDNTFRSAVLTAAVAGIFTGGWGAATLIFFAGLEHDLCLKENMKDFLNCE